MRLRYRHLFLAVPMVVFCLLSPLFGQTGLGSISGRVSDASSAVVPGAQITLTNTETNVRTERISDNLGSYQFLQLNPGSYALSVAGPKMGFKKLERTGITLHVDDRLTIDLALEVGDTRDVVTVAADASQLRTEDAETGQVINNSYIEDLPQLQRDPLALILQSANVQGDGSRAGNILSLGTPGSAANVRSDTTINGGRTSGIEYFVDGIAAGTGRGHSVSQFTPSMDAVDEFKVLTNGISAEYGRLSGGAVAMVTKSGTNGLHGQGFEYLQNNDLNANSWKNNELGGARAPFGNNDFGFTLGGPVIIPKVYNGRNKTFFFVNYEGLRFRESGVLQVASYPTQAERNGDYTQSFYEGFGAQMWDPRGNYVFNSTVGLFQRTTLLGGNGMIVPAADISPVSAAILKQYVPLPNSAPPAGCSSCNNYIAPQNEKRSSNTTSARLDEYLTQNQRLAVRFTAGSYADNLTAWGGPGNSAPGTTINQGRFGTINYDWTASPTLLFNVRGGVHHDPFTGGSLLPAGFSDASIGFDPVTYATLGTHNIPFIWPYAMGTTGPYTNSASAQIMNSTTYEFSPSGTKILGRHTLKFGLDWRRYYDNINVTANGETGFLPDPIGPYVEDNAFEFGNGWAEGVGSFLMGQNDYNWVSGAYTVAMKTPYYGAYIQDDFKVNRKLTLNLGLRYDYEGAATERHNKMYFWDPNIASPFTINAGWNYDATLTAAGINPSLYPAPSWTNGLPKGGIEITGTPAYPSRTASSPNGHQFAPRVGFAYQLNPKTVIHGSFAQMYISTTGDMYSEVTAGSGVALANGANAGWHAGNYGMSPDVSTWANPWAPGNITSYTRNAFLADQQSTATTGPIVYNMGEHMPYELTWSIGVQRDLGRNFLIDAYYSANRGVGLLGNDLISHFPASLLVPANEGAMTTPVVSPQAGQTLATGSTGPTQLLGFLQFPYPYFGPVVLEGTNIGRSSYNALVMKLQRRFRSGFSLLVNYAYSRLLDDVGGPESDDVRMTGSGVGYKLAQSVYTTQSSWGLSPLDQNHRLSVTYLYDLPFGKGKTLLGHPQGLAANVLDGVVGGWALAGTTQWHTGTPITLSPANANNNNTIRVEWTNGSWATSCTADSCLGNPAFTGNSQVLISPSQTPAAGAVSRFDTSNITGSQPFVIGTLPDIFNLRNPSFSQTDLSLMKKFRLHGEGQFIQVRVEALNALNQRGFGPYINDGESANFGLISSAGNVERRIQVSGRIVF